MGGKCTHITEIMPSDMPQWMWDAIDEGLLARRAMEKVAGLEKPDCHWTQDEDGIWQTSCKMERVFDCDGPEENQCNFCPKCGGKLTEVELQEPKL